MFCLIHVQRGEIFHIHSKYFLPRNQFAFFSYTRVEKVNEKTVDWDGIYEKFAEKGVASRQVVRERWSRVLKVRLL